jgi:long-chain acyl-CoA synthetase
VVEAAMVEAAAVEAAAGEARGDLLLERAYRWEREVPDKVFLTQPLGGGAVRDYTWREALAEARRMASYLASLGLPRGSRIALISKNCAHSFIADLAIFMAGHASVFLFPTTDAATVRYVLAHCGAGLLFVGKLDDWPRLAPGVPAGLPCVALPLAPPTGLPSWENVTAGALALSGSPTRAPDDDAEIIYTSGSTGRSKGVVHSFATMAAFCRRLEQAIGVRENDRVISYLPLAHAFERAAIEAAAIYGGTHVFFVESPDTFLRDLQRARPTIFHSVPRLWLKFQLGVFQRLPAPKLRRLLRIPLAAGLVKRKILKGLGLDAARIAISGSAPIPPALIQWYRDLGLELLEGYGMSENYCCSHLSLPGRARAGYVGEPLPGVEVRLAPDGEVLVRSPATMKGYYRDPELTAAAFTTDGFLRTGDCGEIDEAGRLKLTGRVKDLFKTSKGKYVAPVPIEKLLNSDSRIELSCVAGRGQPQPFALVLLDEVTRTRLAHDGVRGEVEAALVRLREQVNAAVADCERLQFLVVVKEPWSIENGLLTPTLKIRRGVIEERYEARALAWYDDGRPVVWEA